MGRPKKEPGDVRDHVLAMKISPREREVWDALRRRLGGKLVPRDTDALRQVVVDACAAHGLEWPTQ